MSGKYKKLKINERPISIFYETIRVFNTLNLFGEIKDSLYITYICCKYFIHNIKPENLRPFIKKHLNKKLSYENIQKCLDKLHYLGYLNKKNNLYTINKEADVTSKLLFGKYNKKTKQYEKYWIDRTGKKIKGIVYINSISYCTKEKEAEKKQKPIYKKVRIKLENNIEYNKKVKNPKYKKREYKTEYVINEENVKYNESIKKKITSTGVRKTRFKYAESVNGISFFFDEKLKLFKNHTFKKYRHEKWTSLRDFLNEELVCNICGNKETVSKFDISRILHVPENCINNFKCNKKQVKIKVPQEYNTFQHKKYSEDFNKKRNKNRINKKKAIKELKFEYMRVTIGNIYSKDSFATRSKSGNNFMKSKIIHFNDDYVYIDNNEPINNIDKKKLLHRKKNDAIRGSKKREYRNISVPIRSFNNNDTGRNCRSYSRFLCSDWKKKYLLPRLDNLSFLGHLTKQLRINRELELLFAES
jgi:hypothetical protein